MAITKNLSVERYATFNKSFTWSDANREPFNLTGYTAVMQVRADYAAVTTLLELSTANSGIVIDPLVGKVSLYISDEDTALLTFTSGVYDLVLENASGDKFRFIEGAFTVIQGVTR